MKVVNAGDRIRAKMAQDPEKAERIETELLRLRIGDEIRAARKRAGLSQKQLASKIKTGQSAISRIEQCCYIRLSLTTLVKIAIALNCELKLRFISK